MTEDNSELEREQQRELILRALPVDGGGVAPIPVEPPAPEPDSSDGVPPLRPLQVEPAELIEPEPSSGLLRAEPAPEE